MERVRSTNLYISKCIIVHVIQARYRNQDMRKKSRYAHKSRTNIIKTHAVMEPLYHYLSYTIYLHKCTHIFNHALNKKNSDIIVKIRTLSES